ncbi:MAG: apolipoprotein N-acyltransferase [Rickettsiales bacterium]|nr:apolipoprotein N-acyltransferase [Rickettsiales bacterium]
MDSPTLLAKLTKLSGWKRCVFLMLMGTCAMASLAPTFLTFLLIPVFSLLFYLLDHSKTWKAAFFTLWWFGLGYFLSGTYWIALSLLVDSTRFAWMIPFATLGLSTILGIYYGLAGLTYHLITQRIHVPAVTARIILFAILLALSELARSYTFTGFPWNAIGYSLSVDEILQQPASLVGIYGLNLLTVLFTTLPILLFYKLKHARYVVGISTILLCTLCIWGYMRVSNTPEITRTITARVVQGNVAKERKWNKELALNEYSRMTQEPSDHPIDLVVWPESSFPYVLEKESEWIDTLAVMLQPQSTLLLGTVRGEGTRKENYKLWNSLAAITAKGDVQYYDKHHLVPFGEYVPFRNILPIKKVIPGKLDFTPGLEKKTLTLPGDITIGPLICYEAIFSRHAFFDEQPDLLISITNDGWFAKSAGPYQHLHMARMRAIEQGVPLIRAANGGISAVYDERGRLIDSIGLKQQSAKDISIALPADKGTLYSRYGLRAFFALIALLFGIGFIFRHDTDL